MLSCDTGKNLMKPRFQDRIHKDFAFANANACENSNLV